MCANLPFETGLELLSRFALENVLSQNCHLKSPGLFWSAPPAHIRKQMKASPLARGGVGLRAVVGRSRTNLRFQPKLVFADRFPSFTTDQLLIHIFLLFLIVPFKLRAFRQLQSGLSSRAKHGGTVFSAVSGSIKDLTTVPGFCNHLGPPNLINFAPALVFLSVLNIYSFAIEFGGCICYFWSKWISRAKYLTFPGDGRRRWG